MGIRIKVKGLSDLRKKKGMFLVTNHISYIDGLVASRIFPLVFIARGDLKEWPLFGIFSKVSETVFVNRTSYGNLHKEIANVSSLLTDGVNVILFPQGTTTSMIEEVSFRSSLFQAPITAGCDILPFTIKYKKVNGKNINDENKDLVFWYGDMEFTPHLFSFLNLKSIEAEVEILSPIKISPQDNRKAVSMISQEAINANLSEAATQH
jgi:1-acyl-sn-glycerol-3-phosphate acyltransferase